MANDRKSQSEKFKEAARELGGDQDEEAFDRALKKMKDQPKRSDKKEDGK